MTQILGEVFGKMGERYMGGHDMMRRMDRQGDVLIWCRKCSVSKLMSSCKREKAGTKEYGKMLERIQVLEEGRVPTKKQENGMKKDEREGSPETSIEDCWTSLRLEVSWFNKGYRI